ncbi:hypothetical protein HDU76_006630 [Blyttiomyces sp. JEL0837]|nr:hypothetical protein HDU76_006630 [Blyttiomyces sp. JEL0837]
MIVFLIHTIVITLPAPTAPHTSWGHFGFHLASSSIHSRFFSTGSLWVITRDWKKKFQYNREAELYTVEHNVSDKLTLRQDLFFLETFTNVISEFTTALGGASKRKNQLTHMIDVIKLRRAELMGFVETNCHLLKPDGTKFFDQTVMARVDKIKADFDNVSQILQHHITQLSSFITGLTASTIQSDLDQIRINCAEISIDFDAFMGTSQSIHHKLDLEIQDMLDSYPGTVCQEGMGTPKHAVKEACCIFSTIQRKEGERTEQIMKEVGQGLKDRMFALDKKVLEIVDRTQAIERSDIDAGTNQAESNRRIQTTIMTQNHFFKILQSQYKGLYPDASASPPPPPQQQQPRTQQQCGNLHDQSHQQQRRQQRRQQRYGRPVQEGPTITFKSTLLRMLCI